MSESYLKHFFLNFILITFPDDSIKNLGVGCEKGESDWVSGSIHAGVVPQERDIIYFPRSDGCGSIW